MTLDVLSIAFKSQVKLRNATRSSVSGGAPFWSSPKFRGVFFCLRQPLEKVGECCKMQAEVQCRFCSLQKSF